MRSGHRPFNTPERFRDQSEAGVLGEMILEADEIVGRILDELEANGLADNTVCFYYNVFYSEKRLCSRL